MEVNNKIKTVKDIHLKSISTLFLALGLLINGYTIEKPNVVMIVLDDLNDFIGVMKGHPQTQTPNIDRLANGGVLFTNAHSNA